MSHDHEGSNGDCEADGDSETDQDADDAPGCTLKSLPRRQLIRAAEVAVRENPANAPAFGFFAAAGADFQVSEPLELAVITAKYWGPTPRTLTVSFMEPTQTTLKAKILGHMNAWSKTCGIKFAATNGVGTVRITRSGSGYWSYLGTDVKLIPTNKPTMSLRNFTLSTPEATYLRVVRHETGHTLGFPHEHARKAIVARIDPAKAYAWFLATYGWNKAMVDAQVLTPLNEFSLMGTPPDQTSIMCYQLPGSITKDGRPILGGPDINATDYRFAGRIYPKPGAAVTTAAATEDEWAEEEDVTVAV